MSDRAAAPSPLRNAAILELDPSTIDIDLTGRIGFFFPDKAVAMGRLIKEDGQRDLVKVSRAAAGSEFEWRLHVGLHRTVGAKMEGVPVYAIEVSGSPEQLREMEASENVHRRDQHPLERAKFVNALCEAAMERLACEQGHRNWRKAGIEGRWAKVKSGETRVEEALQEETDLSADKMSAVYGWQETAAEASRSAIERLAGLESGDCRLRDAEGFRQLALRHAEAFSDCANVVHIRSYMRVRICTSTMICAGGLEKPLCDI